MNMKAFIEALKKFKDRVKIIATGAITGHVNSVIPKDQSKESQEGFRALLALIGGAIVGGTILILKSIAEASTSQIVGVHTVKPSSGVGLYAGAIHLYGYCLQASEGDPKDKEEYEIVEAEDTDLSPLLFKAMRTGESRGLALADEYAFIKDADLFKQLFTQTVVWVITDDIGYLRAKEHIFQHHPLKIMFFLPSCFEVLLWVRECLKKSGVDIKSTQFDKELISGVLGENMKLGLVGQAQLKEWQAKFRFQIKE